MIEKQLTIEKLLETIKEKKCLNCKTKVDINRGWKVPLCAKCMVEVSEDLEEAKNEGMYI